MRRRTGNGNSHANRTGPGHTTGGNGRTTDDRPGAYIARGSFPDGPPRPRKPRRPNVTPAEEAEILLACRAMFGVFSPPWIVKGILKWKYNLSLAQATVYMARAREQQQEEAMRAAQKPLRRLRRS